MTNVESEKNNLFGLMFDLVKASIKSKILLVKLKKRNKEIEKRDKEIEKLQKNWMNSKKNLTKNSKKKIEYKEYNIVII